VKKNMPTTKILLFFSWTLAVLGLALSIYVVLFKGVTTASLVMAILTVIGGLVLAAVLRMLANIGQLIFDANCNLFDDLRTFHKNKSSQHQEILEQFRVFGRDFTGKLVDLRSVTEILGRDLTEKLVDLRTVNESFLMDFKNISERLNCDSKDVNQTLHQINQTIQQTDQNIQQIKEFFLKVKHHIETQQG